MSTIPTSNTDKTTVSDRTVAGPQPDGSTATGTVGNNTGVVAGTYGDNTHVGKFTVNSAGNLTSASAVIIGGSAIFDIRSYGAVGNRLTSAGYIAPSALVVGNHYVIKQVNSTNWVAAGAASNTVGLAFVATATTTGTGQAYVDDTFAIQAAINAAAAVYGGRVYIPSGLWLTSGVSVPVANNPVVAIMGDGPNHSIVQNMLQPSSINNVPLVKWFSTGDTLKNNAVLQNICFNATGNRAVSSPLLEFNGATLVWMHNVVVNSTYDCAKFIASNLYAVQCSFNSGDSSNSHSGCCVHMVNGSANLTGCGLNQNSWNNNELPVAPPLWLQGTSTGNLIANTEVTGAGPRAIYTPSSITSNGTTITVNFPSTHVFNVGDYIVMKGMTPSAYNTFWRVATIGANTLTIASTANPGTVTVMGSVFTVPAAVLVDNSLGAVNESVWSGGLVQAQGYPNVALSAGFYFDGRNGTNANNTLEGWVISGVYIDVGRVGVLITGGGSNGSTETSSRFKLADITTEGNAGDGSSTKLGDIWIEQCPGVQIDTLQGGNVAWDSTNSKAVYAYSDGTGGHITCAGLKIANSDIGGPADYVNNSTNVSKYGLYFDGPIDNVVLTGNVVQGKTASVGNVNSAVTISTLLTSEGNHFYIGSGTPNISDMIPTMASATTISLPFNDVINITGTTTIATINGGWTGRRVMVLASSGLTFSGGNIKTSGTIDASKCAVLTCDGTNWWPTSSGGGTLPTPTPTTLGGVKSLAAVTHKFLTSIGTDGGPVAAQPAQADITGLRTTDTPTFNGINSTADIIAVYPATFAGVASSIFDSLGNQTGGFGDGSNAGAAEDVIFQSSGAGSTNGSIGFYPAANFCTFYGGLLFDGTAPSTLSNGMIWYDGTNFKVRTGGATKTIVLL